MGTQAADAADGDQVIEAGKAKVVDTVAYKGLVPGETYIAVGTLMDKGTGEPFLDKDGNVIELKEDEDAMDTFNLARMDADDDRHRAFSEEAEFQDSGFDIEDAPEDAGADIDVDFDDE